MVVRCTEDSANLKEPQVERELGPRVGKKHIWGDLTERGRTRVTASCKELPGWAGMRRMKAVWPGQWEGRAGTSPKGGGVRECRAGSGVKTCPQQAVSSRTVWVDRVRPDLTWKGCQNGQD